jgi:hypothetical protein
MINKKVLENEILLGMHKELVKNATNKDKDNLSQAVDYLNSAIDIFEDAGMKVQADKILNILRKIANEDHHTKGLNSKKMIENLKNNGTVFNMSDDGNAANDLLDIEVNNEPLEVFDRKETFEDTD